MAGPAKLAAVKLGKAAPKVDVRTLRLAKYIDTTVLPTPPADLDLTEGVPDWPMYKNDEIGDCTCAAAGHMIEAWTAVIGKFEELTDDPVLKAFDAVKSQGPDGEWGAVELDVLNYWRQTGIGGHTIGAFARVSPWDQNMVRTATWLFAGLYIGVQLPVSAQGKTTWEWGGTLSGPDTPGSWGGHAVDVVRYNSDGLTVVSWGTLIDVTWDFWDHYCDEAYAILTNDFLSGEDLPNGFDLDTLATDLQLLSG